MREEDESTKTNMMTKFMTMIMTTSMTRTVERSWTGCVGRTGGGLRVREEDEPGMQWSPMGGDGMQLGWMELRQG